jgi:hypothetical protein
MPSLATSAPKRLVITLKLLLLQPGELTSQYLAGRRKHHVLPLRLYLSISLVLFLILQGAGRFTVVEGLHRPDLTAAEKGALPSVVLSVPGPAHGHQGRRVCVRRPAQPAVRNRAPARRHRHPGVPEPAAQRQRARGEPLWRRDVRAAAAVCGLPAPGAPGQRHALHRTPGVCAAPACVLVLPSQTWLTVLGLLAVPVYGWLAVGRVYGGGRLSRLLRSALVSVLYLATLAAVVVGLSLWALLF